MQQTDDLRIQAIHEVEAPATVHERHPITERAAQTVYETRQAIHRLLTREDDRLLVVIGPCSVHDPEAAIAYAKKLIDVRDQLSDELLIVMRVYFEKPRTATGWKGFINDPRLDDSFHIEEGITAARRLLVDIAELGLPAGSEALDPLSPQYLADLISWYAIGARTTESQTHREMASGLSTPVGFKNGTDGNVRVAAEAIRAAQQPHHFLSVTKGGHSAIVSTKGNEDCHIILRGGSRSPNFDGASVDAACQELARNGLAQHLMIDASHANSGKKHENQLAVAESIAAQLEAGESRIVGAMVESHLVGGRQDLVPGKPLVYGQSITDACLGWDDSVALLERLAAGVRGRRLRVANLSGK